MKDAFVISRRRMMAGLGATPLVALLTTASRVVAECFETQEETEGPYWVDERLQRSDITIDPSDGSVVAGVPLTLTITVRRADADCATAAGVQVDVWHCSAAGLYSDESANGTVGRMFLRGHQMTDANGAVTFTTIYPGWYQGRTIHIHVRVRAFEGDTTTVNFTSQIYFPEEVNAQVIAGNPEYDHGTRATFNGNDNLYLAASELALAADGNGGFAGAIDVALFGLPAGTAAGVCGDADASGDVTVTDGVQTLREAAGLSSDCQTGPCDVDASGAVTVTDGVNVLRKAAGVAVALECP